MFPFADSVAGMIQYIFVIGMMVTSVVLAKQMSGGAAKGLMNWGSKTAGAASFGLAAWVGRRTLGAAGSKLADSRYARELTASDNLLDQWKGKSMIGIGNFAKRSSFDFRSTGVAAGAGLGMAGQAQRGGYEAWFKARQKAQEERNKGYGAETKETADEIKGAKDHELKMQEAYRLAAPADKKAAEDRMKEASRDREIAEDKAKIERAQSQQNLGRFGQGTPKSTEESSLGRRWGTIFAAVVNPADRAAAAELEKNAAKDQRKAEGELALHEYNRDDAEVQKLKALIDKTKKEQIEAAQEANDNLKDINENLGKLVEEARNNGIWDEQKQRVWEGASGLSANGQRIQTDIDTLRLREKEQRKTRDDVIKAVDERGERTLKELNQALTNAVEQRESNSKGREAKERREREDQLKVVMSQINEGQNAGTPPAQTPPPAAKPTATDDAE